MLTSTYSIVAEDMGVAVVKEIYYFGVTVGAKGDRAEIIVPLANQKALLHAHNNFNPSEPSSADNRLASLLLLLDLKLY